jgi:hypothetical protein
MYNNQILLVKLFVGIRLLQVLNNVMMEITLPMMDVTNVILNVKWNVLIALKINVMNAIRLVGQSILIHSLVSLCVEIV